MKKLLLLGLIAFFSACSENDLQKKQMDYNVLLANLDEIHQGAFSVALKSTSANMYSDTYGYLKANYLEGNFEFNPNELKAKVDKTSRISSVEDLDLGFLTETQRVFAIPFLNNILNQDDLTIVNNLADSYNNDVISSSLSDEHKYQLLAIGSAIKVGAKFIEDTLKANNSGGRTKKIDIKSALRSGVESLVVGAAYGAYVGATGGTIAVPFVGTVVGGVGVAVVGGAVGFVTGVAGSIASQLFWGD